MEDWRMDAACVDHDPELWFPAPAATADTMLAKAICGECPVLASCRDWALDNLPIGVAGGLTEEERRVVRRGRGAPSHRPDRYDTGLRPEKPAKRSHKGKAAA